MKLRITITDEMVSTMDNINLNVNNDYINELIQSPSVPLLNEYLIEQQHVNDT